MTDFSCRSISEARRIGNGREGEEDDGWCAQHQREVSGQIRLSRKMSRRTGEASAAMPKEGSTREWRSTHIELDGQGGSCSALRLSGVAGRSSGRGSAQCAGIT
ncbi:MAG: hypothetical protein ACLUD2_09190 [Clostridium sp.]